MFNYAKGDVMNGKQLRTLGIMIAVFCVSATANRYGVLAPVHELGHILAAYATGGRASMTSWTLVTSYGGVVWFIIIAGYFFEMIVWQAMAIFGFVKGHPYVAAFGLGSAVQTYLNAPANGLDFVRNPDVARTAVPVFYLLFGIGFAAILIAAQIPLGRVVAQMREQEETLRRARERIARKQYFGSAETQEYILQTYQLTGQEKPSSI